MQAQMLARGAMMQAGMVSVGDPQVKDDLFAGTEKFAAGASDVTNVNLGPDMLGMVSGKHGGDMAHKMNFMVVRSYTYPRTGMYNMADVDAYREKLKSGNWNCFIHTYESKTGESTDICNRALPNSEGNEMVIMTVEPKELTFIHMSGKGSLADLGKLGKLGGLGGDMPTPPTPPEPRSRLRTRSSRYSGQRWKCRVKTSHLYNEGRCLFCLRLERGCGGWAARGAGAAAWGGGDAGVYAGGDGGYA